MNKNFLKLVFTIIILLKINHDSYAQNRKYSKIIDKMGSPFKMTIYSKDSLKANEVFESSLLFVDSLIHIFSDYDSTSEISLINKQAGYGAIKISPPMLKLLLIAQNSYYSSNGAYNIAIGPLSLLWRSARKSKKIPNKKEINATIPLTNYDIIDIDSVQQTILLPLKNMRLDLGGLGKGYIAHLVLDQMKNKGIDHALIDAGGKIVMSTPGQCNENWKIGINIPTSKKNILPAELLLKNESVSTSGDLYQFFYYKRKKYSHIINPKTGLGITTQKNVTVIASNGAEADWLSTACSVLSIRQAKKLCKERGASILIAVNKKRGVKYYSTPLFNTYLNNAPFLNEYKHTD